MAPVELSPPSKIYWKMSTITNFNGHFMANLLFLSFYLNPNQEKYQPPEMLLFLQGRDKCNLINVEICCPLNPVMQHMEGQR